MGRPFDGGDTLPYNVSSAAILAAIVTTQVDGEPAPDLVLLDGDRLSTLDYRQLVGGLGVRRRCALLEGHTVAAERRAARALEVGKAQNASWVKGRATKARRFWEMFSEEERLTVLVGRRTPDLVATSIRAWLT